jgi:hypothetical protein
LVNRYQAASVLCLPAVAGLLTAPAKGAQGVNPLVGAWRLVSVVDPHPPSAALTFADESQGLLIYTAAGQVAVQITQQQQHRTACETYSAYFGTYDADLRKSSVTHHVQASLRPEEVGQDFERRFELSANRLVLIPLKDGKPQTARLTWQRVSS